MDRKYEDKIRWSQFCSQSKNCLNLLQNATVAKKLQVIISYFIVLMSPFSNCYIKGCKRTATHVDIHPYLSAHNASAMAENIPIKAEK